MASGSCADEQVLERVEAVHRVARADARRRPRRSRPARSWPRTTGAGPGPRRPGTAGPAARPVARSRIAVIRTCGSIAVHRVRRREAVNPTRTMGPSGIVGADRLPEVPTMTIDPRRAATVDFDHVSKSYEKPKNKKEAAKLKDQPGAVNDLSLAIPAGKICVLVGPSGCGKTTSLKMVNRLIEPTSGRILLDGADAAKRDVTELRREIGYVIQHRGLFPHQTIIENVGTVPRLLGWPEARRNARSEELMAIVGLDPARYARRYPEPALGRRAAARRRRPGPRRGSADHAHGRAVRGRRPDRSRAAPGRVPAPSGGDREDDPVRDPRHRRGDQDGRPRRGPPGRRPAGPVRVAGGPARQPRLGVRGTVRRRGSRSQAPRPQPDRRPRPSVSADGDHRDGCRRRRRRRAWPIRSSS